jgi:hypothetical protein
MNKQASRPDAEVERFWDRIRDAGSLRAAMDRQAALIPAPDWDAVHAAGAQPRSLGWLRPGLALGAAACVAALAAVLLVVPIVRDQPEPAGVSVVDQVFRSTASDSLETAGRHSPTSFSSVLKTIDAGFQRWDERLDREE